MPRIDIELTSSRPDGTWTWRAAGARQPKGTLDGSLLYEGVKVGDVVRVDAEMDIEGITVSAVLPPKTKRQDSGRLEIIGPPPREREADVVVASGPPRRPPSPRRDDRPPRPADDRRHRSDRPDRPPRGPRSDDGTDRRRAGPGPGAGTDSARPGEARGPREARHRDPARRPPRAPRQEAGPAPPPRPRPKRLQAGKVHREAVLASLPPEERPVAEHVLRGGLPAVRQAVEEQNAKARAAGDPEVRAEALLALAEGLVPRLRAAEWRDRAEAAVAQAEDVAVRDLRALVAGADAAGRDEQGRTLTAQLREALERRSGQEREAWLTEIVQCLDGGRVLRALRASARPPEPGSTFPADLAERLGAAAGEAMGPDVPADRWAAVLEAVDESPVRRLVKPRGLPQPAPEPLVLAARQAVPRVPGLAVLVGTPEPSPPKGGGPRPPGPGRGAPGARPPGGSAGPRIPPRPPQGRPGPPLRPPPPPPRPATARPPGDADAPIGAKAPEPPAAVEAPAAPDSSAAVETHVPADAPAAPPATDTPAVADAPEAPTTSETPDTIEQPSPVAVEGATSQADSSGDDGDDPVLVEELG